MFGVGVVGSLFHRRVLARERAVGLRAEPLVLSGEAVLRCLLHVTGLYVVYVMFCMCFCLLLFEIVSHVSYLLQPMSCLLLFALRSPRR